MYPKKKQHHSTKVYQGIVDHVSPHNAYIIVEGRNEDILVTQAYLQGAMHQDQVEVRVRSSNPKEGRITKILTRANTTLVGRIRKESHRCIVLPDHKRLHHSVVLPLQGQEKLHNDDKVLVRLTHYPTSQHGAKGKIEKVFGAMGSHQAETAAIMAQFQLEENFAPHIEKKVAALPAQLSTEELQRRVDFRKVTTFTIDPVDAKDFDDALSLRKLPNGDYEIGIHVADVTHYVRPGTALDEEAQRRATSVYLVGHVVPMLPERLANDLCSLKPHVDRPAFSVIVTLDKNAQVKKMRIAESVIHSNHRFTYDEAHEVLAQKKGAFYEELAVLDQLAKKLRKDRIAKGAICFESRDIDIQLDDKGNPIHIEGKKAHTTHQLIEEFMLLANRLVARHVWGKKAGKHHLPFLYRTHDAPEAQKINDFASFVRKLGYTFHTDKATLPKAYNALLAKCKGTNYEMIIQSLSIRTMAQATYNTLGKGHFGLAFPHYTHFTSPIRRYPDLMVHRLLKRYAQKASYDEATRQACEEVARIASTRERIAVEAERASIACKQALFVKKLEGQVLAGTIIGLTEWGMYVELKKFKCEGMIRLADLPSDYYIYDAKQFRVVGKRKGKIYQMGDTLDVRIKQANIAKRQVDMAIP